MSLIRRKCKQKNTKFFFSFSQCPNFGRIIEVLLNDGVDALSEKCQMLPGTPLKPMLAHPTKGVQEVLQRFDGIKFTCEYKYDGERAQVSVEFLNFFGIAK